MRKLLRALVIAALLVLATVSAQAAVPSVSSGWTTGTTEATDDSEPALPAAAVDYHGQLHVFSDVEGAGIRHHWYDGHWRAETLDDGESSGSDIAVTVLGSQLQVFTAHASGTGVRHLWFDGTWKAETLDADRWDQALSATVWSGNGQIQLFGADMWSGGVRHGWFDGEHWRFETLDVVPRNPVSATASTTYEANGDLQLFATLEFGGMRHGWFDGSWHFEHQPFGPPTPTPPLGVREVVATNLADQLQVFSDTTEAGVNHMWFDGQWHGELLDPVGSTGTGLSTTVYRGNGQLQLFGRSASSDNVRHSWFDGTWRSEELPAAAAVTATASISFSGGLHVFSPTSLAGLTWLRYSTTT